MSEVLRRAVRESGQSLGVIAAATGIDRSSLSRFLRAERSLRLDVADKLAEYLNLTLAPAGKPRAKNPE